MPMRSISEFLEFANQFMCIAHHGQVWFVFYGRCYSLRKAQVSSMDESRIKT